MTLSVKLFVAALTCFCLLSACAEMKQTGKAVGHTAKNVTTAVGHAARDTTKTIGYASKDAVKAVGQGVSEAATKMSKESDKLVSEDKE